MFMSGYSTSASGRGVRKPHRRHSRLNPLVARFFAFYDDGMQEQLVPACGHPICRRGVPHHHVDDALPCGLRRDVHSIKGVLVHGDVHHGGLLAHYAGGCSGASSIHSPCVS